MKFVVKPDEGKQIAVTVRQSDVARAELLVGATSATAPTMISMATAWCALQRLGHELLPLSEWIETVTVRAA